MLLNPKLKYLQIAFNRTLPEVEEMINLLPASPRILIEAGTPLIKQYGQRGIRTLSQSWRAKVGPEGYVVADLKCMDRGSTEVAAAAEAGASAATCLALAPIETVNEFIKNCQESKIDSMVDMMNVPFPFEILQKLKVLPNIIVLHRGVDENQINRAKALPHHDITRIKGSYNLTISIAGGETSKDITRTYFNGAEIAVIWRPFHDTPNKTENLARQFLRLIKGYDEQ
jgi:bifunctional enzyme Fae/Hps